MYRAADRDALKRAIDARRGPDIEECRRVMDDLGTALGERDVEAAIGEVIVAAAARLVAAQARAAERGWVRPLEEATLAREEREVAAARTDGSHGAEPWCGLCRSTPCECVKMAPPQQQQRPPPPPSTLAARPVTPRVDYSEWADDVDNLCADAD
jgi:hypothetical protein